MARGARECSREHRSPLGGSDNFLRVLMDAGRDGMGGLTDGRLIAGRPTCSHLFNQSTLAVCKV